MSPIPTAPAATASTAEAAPPPPTAVPQSKWRGVLGLGGLGAGLLAVIAAAVVTVRRVMASAAIPDLRAYAAADLGDISAPIFPGGLSPPPLSLRVGRPDYTADLAFLGP